MAYRGLQEFDLSKKSVVYLAGIDGTGKTSHALRLVAESKRIGRKCSYVWLRTPHFMSLPFMVLCRLTGFTNRHVSSSGQVLSEHRYYRKPISLLWPWVQLVDLAFFVLMRIHFSVLLGNLVVCDRCSYDVLVDMMVDLGDKHLHRKAPGRLIRRLLPRNTAVCFLDLDETVAITRKNDVPNLRYLTIRREYYRQIAFDFGIPVVDADESFDLVHHKILGYCQA